MLASLTCLVVPQKKIEKQNASLFCCFFLKHFYKMFFVLDCKVESTTLHISVHPKKQTRVQLVDLFRSFYVHFHSSSFVNPLAWNRVMTNAHRHPLPSFCTLHISSSSLFKSVSPNFIIESIAQTPLQLRRASTCYTALLPNNVFLFYFLHSYY